MIISKSNRWKIAYITLVVLCTFYITGYFVTTETFQGQSGNDVMDFRLFNSKLHYTFFLPIIKIEEIVKTKETSNYFFYGHIKNGASLPPSRDKEK